MAATNQSDDCWVGFALTRKAHLSTAHLKTYTTTRYCCDGLITKPIRGAMVIDDQFRLMIPDYEGYRVQIYQKDVIELDRTQFAAPLRNPTLEVT